MPNNPRKDLENLIESISEAELEYWQKRPIKGLGQFYSDFGNDCPAHLQSPFGY